MHHSYRIWHQHMGWFGVFIINQETPTTSAIYIQVTIQVDSVPMPEATALRQNSSNGGTKSTSPISNVSYPTDNQAITNFFNSADTSSPPHWKVQVLLEANSRQEFKVCKINRSLNTTAHTLASHKLLIQQLLPILYSLVLLIAATLRVSVHCEGCTFGSLSSSGLYVAVKFQ